MRTKTALPQSKVTQPTSTTECALTERQRLRAAFPQWLRFAAVCLALLMMFPGLSSTLAADPPVAGAPPAAAPAAQPAVHQGEANLVLPDLNGATFLGGFFGGRTLLYLGLVCGFYVMYAIAPSLGMPRVPASLATLIMFVPAIIGSRIWFVLDHWAIYRHEPRRIWRHSDGGMTLYGGLVLALALSPVILTPFRLSFLTFWDGAMFTILVGMIFTRVGCLFNGCCSGRHSDGRGVFLLIIVFLFLVVLFVLFVFFLVALVTLAFEVLVFLFLVVVVLVVVFVLVVVLELDPREGGHADAGRPTLAGLGEHLDSDLVPLQPELVESVLDRRWPSHCLGFQRSGEGEMALSAHDKVRLRDEALRGRNNAINPVLADADEAEPLAHGAAH